MDYGISIYEYGIKEYMLKFNSEDMTKKAYEILKEYFNFLNIFVYEEECEIYIMCTNFHLKGIKEVLKIELDLNGDWV